MPREPLRLMPRGVGPETARDARSWKPHPPHPAELGQVTPVFTGGCLGRVGPRTRRSQGTRDLSNRNVGMFSRDFWFFLGSFDPHCSALPGRKGLFMACDPTLGHLASQHAGEEFEDLGPITVQPGLIETKKKMDGSKTTEHEVAPAQKKPIGWWILFLLNMEITVRALLLVGGPYRSLNTSRSPRHSKRGDAPTVVPFHRCSQDSGGYSTSQTKGSFWSTAKTHPTQHASIWARFAKVWGLKRTLCHSENIKR